jgi:DNA invertase Pin-like site-specific DNA recombinase
MRCAAYVRVSREEQVLGYSLEAQERLVRDWVSQQRGELSGELVAVYRDEGHSARTDDRPAFQQMVADARTGQFEAIVVHKFDRLARDRYDAVAYKTLWRNKLGIKVLSASEPSQDSDGPLGMLVEGILEVVAHWYSLNLAAETRKGKREKAEEGLWHGAAPTGYCNGRCQTCAEPNGPGYCPHAGQPDRGDGKALLPHPVESEAIRLAFQWYSSGEWSDRDIAHLLNEARFETADGRTVPFRTKFYGRKDSRPGPGPFEKDTVKDILTRPFYAGLVEYHGLDPQTGKRRTSPLIVRQGKHQPLVSLELFQQCQDVRRSRGKAVDCQAKGRSTAVYPLAGILMCGECGMPLRSLSIGGTRYYRCRTRIQRKEGCSQFSVRADAIEPVVDGLMARLVLPAEVRQRVEAYLVRDEGLEALEVRKQGLQAELARAQELYLAGDIGRDRYERVRAEFQRAMAELQPEAHTGRDTMQPLLDDFDTFWALATPLERKGLLAATFRRVWVRDGQVVDYEAAPPFDRLLAVDA